MNQELHLMPQAEEVEYFIDSLIDAHTHSMIEQLYTETQPIAFAHAVTNIFSALPNNTKLSAAHKNTQSNFSPLSHDELQVMYSDLLSSSHTKISQLQSQISHLTAKHKYQVDCLQAGLSHQRWYSATLESEILVLKNSLVDVRREHSEEIQSLKNEIQILEDSKYLNERLISDLRQENGQVCKLLEELNAVALEDTLALHHLKSKIGFSTLQAINTGNCSERVESVLESLRHLELMNHIKQMKLLIAPIEPSVELKYDQNITKNPFFCELAEEAFAEYKSQTVRLLGVLHKYSARVSELQVSWKRSKQQNQQLREVIEKGRHTQQEYLQRIDSLQQIYDQILKKVELFQQHATESEKRRAENSETIKIMEASIRKLQIEKQTLQHNLQLIHRAHTQEQEQPERHIVEQIVEKNCQTKVRIKQMEDKNERLERQLNGLQSRLNEVESESKNKGKAMDQLKAQAQQEKEHLLETISLKDEHNAQLLKRIEQCDESLNSLAQVVQRVRQLQQENALLQMKLADLTRSIEFSKEKEEHSKTIHQQLLTHNQQLLQQNNLMREDLKHHKELLKAQMNKKQEQQQQHSMILDSRSYANSNNTKIVETRSKAESMRNQQQPFGVLHQNGIIGNRSFGDTLRFKPTPLQQQSDSVVNAITTTQSTPSNSSKHVQSIMKLNEVINFMLNYCKGYDFKSGDRKVRHRCWIVSQGMEYIQKACTRQNIESKFKNFVRVQEIIKEDTKTRELLEQFESVMGHYF